MWLITTADARTHISIPWRTWILQRESALFTGVFEFIAARRTPRQATEEAAPKETGFYMCRALDKNIATDQVGGSQGSQSK